MMEPDEIRTRDAMFRELEAVRADGIEHLHCGHCGGIDDVREINLIEHVRHLCVNCRRFILEWI